MFCITSSEENVSTLIKKEYLALNFNILKEAA